MSLAMESSVPCVIGWCVALAALPDPHCTVHRAHPYYRPFDVDEPDDDDEWVLADAHTS